MSIVRELLTRFTFKSEGGKLSAVKSSVGKTKKELRLASRAAYKLKQELRGLQNLGRGLAAVFIGSRVIKAITSDFANAADKAAKFSQATGMSIEAYQGLGHAAQLSGVDVAEMDKALQQLAKRSLEVTQGNKKTKEAFTALGVAVTTSEGKLRAAEDILLSLGEAVKANPNDKKTIGLLMQVLGRTGAKMIPLLKQGKIGIKEMMLEAKKLGIVLSKEEAAQAEKFNDAKLRSIAVLKGLRNQISLRVLPAITNIMQKFQAWAKEGDNLKTSLRVVLIVSKALAVAFAAFLSNKLLKAYTSLISIIGKAIVAYRTMGITAALAQIKMYAIIAAIAAVIWIAKQFYEIGKGKENFLSRLLGTENTKQLKKAILSVVATLRKAWKDIKPDVIELGKTFTELGKSIYRDVIKPLAPILTGYVKTQLLGVMWALKGISRVLPIISESTKLWLSLFARITKASGKTFTGIVLKAAWMAGLLSGITERIWLMFKGPFDKIKKAGKTLLSPLMWALKKVIRAYNRIAGLLGRKKIDLNAHIKQSQTNAADAKTKALLKRRGKMEGNSNHTTSVGSVSVVIEGTTGMGAEAVKIAVKEGVINGMADMIKQASLVRSPA